MKALTKDIEKDKRPKPPKIDINLEVSKHTFQAHGIPIYCPFAPYDGQKMFIQYVLVPISKVIDCLKRRTNGIIQSPTGTGKTISLLCSTLSWVRHEQLVGRPPMRVIYTSRTHAQLKQVVQELLKTGFDVKLAILGSRDHTCINEDLKELSGQGKELECRLRIMKKAGLFCKYFHHEEYYEKMNSVGKISDLEDLKFAGKTQGFCPFFYEKHTKGIANLILMPYSYILDERASSSEDFAQIVQNSIIIFDEAHNIPNACESSKQFCMSLSNLSRALQHLADLRERRLQQEQKCQKKPSSESEEMKSTISQLEMHASYVSLVHAHIQTLYISLEEGLVMNVNDFLQCLDNGTGQGEFGKLGNKIQALVQSSTIIQADILLKPYWALQAWFSFLGRVAEMYALSKQESFRSYFKVHLSYSGSDIRINIMCLDAKVGFGRITRMNPHIVLLTSGTLSPLNSLPLELQLEFNKPLSCPHIMSKEQVNGCILTAGPNKVHLNFSFENRDNAQLYKQLGVVLVQIVNKTPNGVIIFVPSYSVLEKIKIELTNSGAMSRLYSKKNIFFEKSNSADFKPILDKYLEEATKPKGALLFALARGKISEGLDFADEKCRAVILVGVPYPAAKDLKVISKMEYMNMKSTQAKSMNGNQWYICETIRCINQSIGRIIRNKNDYGSIYLLDERFRKSELLSQISGWARQCLKIVDDFQQFKFKLQLFQEYFRKKSEAQEVQSFFTSHLGTKLANNINPQMRPVKSSISVPPNQIRSETVEPEAEFRKIKAQSKNEAQTIETDKKQPSRQKLIFGRAKKSLPLNGLKQCPICRQERTLIKNTECIHEICEECWDIWLKKDLRCPVCRVRVREKYLIKS